MSYGRYSGSSYGSGAGSAYSGAGSSYGGTGSSYVSVKFLSPGIGMMCHCNLFISVSLVCKIILMSWMQLCRML